MQDNVAQQIIKGLEVNLSPSEAARIKPGEPVNSLAYEYYLRGVDLVGSHDFPMAVKMLEKSAESSELRPHLGLPWSILRVCGSFEFGGLEQYQKAICL